MGKKKNAKRAKRLAPREVVGARAVTKQQRADVALAADLRRQGVVPVGLALTQALAGERDLRTLKALNVADGVA